MTLRYAHLAPEHLRSEIAKTERPVEGESRAGDPACHRFQRKDQRKRRV